MTRETDKTLHATVKYAEDLADEVAARIGQHDAQVEQNTSDIASLKQRADAKDGEVYRLMFAVDDVIPSQIRNLSDRVDDCKDITDQINFLHPNDEPVEDKFNAPNIERVQAEIAPIMERVETAEDLASAAQAAATQAQTSAGTAADVANAAAEAAASVSRDVASVAESAAAAQAAAQAAAAQAARNVNGKADGMPTVLEGEVLSGGSRLMCVDFEHTYDEGCYGASVPAYLGCNYVGINFLERKCYADGSQIDATFAFDIDGFFEAHDFVTCNTIITMHFQDGYDIQVKFSLPIAYMAESLTDDAVAAIISRNNLAKKSDIPSVAGLATQTWVTAQINASLGSVESALAEV